MPITRPICPFCYSRRSNVVESTGPSTGYQCVACQRRWDEVHRARGKRADTPGAASASRESLPERPRADMAIAGVPGAPPRQVVQVSSAVAASAAGPLWTLQGTTKRRVECRMTESADRAWVLTLTFGQETLLSESFRKASEAIMRANSLKSTLIAKDWTVVLSDDARQEPSGRPSLASRSTQA
jgi:hypothetical protein